MRKRNDHGQRNLCHFYEIICKDRRHYDLQCHLLHWIKSIRTLHDYLQIVIQKTDQSEPNGKEQNRNDLRVIFYIDQRCDRNGCKDDHASHGRRPCLLQMRLDSFYPLCLPHLQLS